MGEGMILTYSELELMDMSQKELETLHRNSSQWKYDADKQVHVYEINNEKYYKLHLND